MLYMQIANVYNRKDDVFIFCTIGCVYVYNDYTKYFGSPKNLNIPYTNLVI